MDVQSTRGDILLLKKRAQELAFLLCSGGSLHKHMAAGVTLFPTACAATPAAPQDRAARKNLIWTIDVVNSETYHIGLVPY